MSKQRKEISDKYKWDLSKVYSSSDEVKADIKKLKTMVDDYLKYKGKITSSSNISIDEAVTLSLINNYSVDDCIRFKEILEEFR